MFKFGLCYLLGIIVLLAVIQQGTSLKCYQCRAQYGGICGTISKVDTKKIGTISCGSKQKYCGTQQIRGNGTSQNQTAQSTIVRNCFTNTTCDTVNSMSCYTCSKDKCNSAVSIMPSFTIATISVWIIKRFGNCVIQM